LEKQAIKAVHVLDRKHQREQGGYSSQIESEEHKSQMEKARQEESHIIAPFKMTGHSLMSVVRPESSSRRLVEAIEASHRTPMLAPSVTTDAPLFKVQAPTEGSSLVESVHDATMAFLSEVIDSKNEIMKKFILNSAKNSPDCQEKMLKLKAQVK
jgi:hypothetical protein